MELKEVNKMYIDFDNGELVPQYDTRKSFYGKAITIKYEDNYLIIFQLYSYNTKVASITFDKDDRSILYEYNGKYSQTTTRHQKEFFKQGGLDNEQIKRLFKNGTLEIGGAY